MADTPLRAATGAAALAAVSMWAAGCNDSGNGDSPATQTQTGGSNEAENQDTAAADATAASADTAEGMPTIPPRKDDAERKSKNGRAEGTIDGIEVVVTYGRPKARDRQLWGELVPYGKVWRTGADEATVIAFDQDVTIEGEELDRGAYALFTIPTKEDWTVIFNRQAEQWGAYDYDESEDALRVEVTPSETDEPTEELTFEITSSDVALRWGTKEVRFDVAAQ